MPYPRNDGPDLDDDGPLDENASYRVTASELRSFVERIERMNADIEELRGCRKEVFAEARGRGYDVKAVRALIALRRKDPAKVSEQEAVLHLYREALGDV